MNNINQPEVMWSMTGSKNYLFDCHQEIIVLDFSNFWNFRWLWWVYDFQSNEVTPIFLNHAKLYVLVLLPTNYSPSLSFLQRFDNSLIEKDLGQLTGRHKLEFNSQNIPNRPMRSKTPLGKLSSPSSFDSNLSWFK